MGGRGGRGRGRKLTNGSRTHEEDKGRSSGEEVVVPAARKRRGRPQKRVAEKINQAEVKKKLEEAADDGYQVGGAAGDAKLTKASRAQDISAAGTGGTSKRTNKVPKEEEEDDSNLDNMEENSSSTRSSNDESSTRSSGFRQVGSRRKSTPRRAAEAGL